MRVLVVDTETTGLPYFKDGHQVWPSIVQWSFVVFDTDTDKVLQQHDFIIKSLDPISAESISIHGIHPEMNAKLGFDFKDIHAIFEVCVDQSIMIIGHNIDFDIHVIRYECQRLGCIFRIPPAVYCTMKASKNICCIPRHGYYKNPKLIETYEFLFNETPKGLHNSMQDVWACLRCFCMLMYEKNIVF
jgi:DNA polymerase-3 subunit epsilon